MATTIIGLGAMSVFEGAMTIGALVAWAALSDVDRVGVANGVLVTSKPTILVQPLERPRSFGLSTSCRV